MKNQTRPRTRYDIRVHADGFGNWHARVRNDSTGFFYAADDKGIALAKRAGREAIMRELRQRSNGGPIRTVFQYSFAYAVHQVPRPHEYGTMAGPIDRSRFHYIDVYEPEK